MWLLARDAHFQIEMIGHVECSTFCFYCFECWLLACFLSFYSIDFLWSTTYFWSYWERKKNLRPATNSNLVSLFSFIPSILYFSFHFLIWSWAMTRRPFSFSIQNIDHRFDVVCPFFLTCCCCCFLKVPTDLGLVSHQVQLEVLVPDVFILGPKDLIVDRGTTLSLVCIVENVRIQRRIEIFSIWDSFVANVIKSKQRMTSIQSTSWSYKNTETYDRRRWQTSLDN